MSGEEAHTDTVYVDVQSDQQPSQEHINLLLTAQAPLVVVGSNKLDESVRAEVLKLSANNNVPFILTPMARAKCTLTENERNYAVVDEKLGYAISKCDVALVVCTEVNWQLHFEVKKMSFNKDKVKFIFVNVQQEEIEHLKPAHIGLLGEVKAVLELINTSKVDEQFISKRVQWVTAIKGRHEESFFEDDDEQKQNERFTGYHSKALSYKSPMVPVCCQLLRLYYHQHNMPSYYSMMIAFLLSTYVVGFILNPAASYFYRKNSKDKLKWNRICACLIALLHNLTVYCMFLALVPKLHITMKILIPVAFAVYCGAILVYQTGEVGNNASNEDHDHISTMANSIVGISLPGLITASRIMAPADLVVTQPQLSLISIAASIFLFMNSLLAHILMLITTVRPRVFSLHVNSMYNLLVKCFIVGVLIVACGFVDGNGNPLSIVVFVIAMFLRIWYPEESDGDGAAKPTPADSRYLDVLVVNLAGIILGVDGTLMYAAS